MWHLKKTRQMNKQNKPIDTENKVIIAKAEGLERMGDKGKKKSVKSSKQGLNMGRSVT